uniref:Uncharacterized protein n=1 Tax=Arundo donax TaxID=35708 RepID=A0A0A8YXG7_ARUDO
MGTAKSGLYLMHNLASSPTSKHPWHSLIFVASLDLLNSNSVSLDLGTFS